MNEAEVRDGVVAGLGLALKRAKAWSHGRVWPGDSGAENLIQVSVAEKLYAAGKTYRPVIELEASLARLGIEGDRRRVDIALMRHADNYYAKPHPFCVVEVKKAPASFKADLEKIRDLFEQSKTLRYGFLATYFQHRLGDRARTGDKVMGDIIVGVFKEAKRLGLKPSTVEARPLGRVIKDENGHRHCAGAIVHRLKRLDDDD